MKSNIGYTEAKIYRGLYEKYKDDPETDADQLKQKAQVFELFGQALDIDPGADLQLMDTGILNPYIKAYVYGAMKHAGIDDDTQERIINGLAAMLDTYTAAEIMEQVNKHRNR